MSDEDTKKNTYPTDPGLKVDEVAAELGIDRSSARRLIISQIPHYVVAAGRSKKSPIVCGDPCSCVGVKLKRGKALNLDERV